jgi:uncharacterized membrane protein
MVIVFVNNDSFLYHNSILRITSVTNQNYTQNIQGKIINGKNKNKIINIKNIYTKSNLYSQKYSVHDKVILSKDLNSIINYKRDIYLAIIIIIFIDLLLIVGKSRGFLTIIAMIIESFIYYLSLKYYLAKDINLILIFSIISIIFTFISMALSVGFNKKSYICMLSVIITTIINSFLGIIVFYLTDGSGIMFDQLGFLLTPYKQIFISEIIICGLGAIMDIAITLTSSLNELINKNPKITNEELHKSGINIAKDTMGTMLNVLFFTNICMSLTKYLVILQNKVSIATIFTNYMSLDISRSLITNIGIVIAIPITIYLDIKLLRGKK